ncbi:MAG: 50S ribosomal protein L10 [Euryarchaeota archaeon]|nr:50S ribosomal protein L10 [Euryarchaeota archaeon]
MAHVASWKKDVVADLADAMTSHHVVAIVSVKGIPSAQLQKMRAGLRKDADVVMTRNTLVDIALTEAAKKVPGLETLKTAVDGQCAVITTDMNPFKLFRALEATKSASPAKAGDIAPEDITIKAGETPFKPGPIVGELQKVGIPAGIENGKVVFKKDKVLVEKGKPVPGDLAKVLPRLEIFPMTVGLDLMAAFEGGVLYGRDVLNIPADYYTNMLSTAARNALALSMSIAYVTPQTITPLLAKAYREAMALSVEAAYPTKDNIKILLAKADAQMAALARKTDGLEDERLKKRI